jgi:hypothetical protein
VLNKNSRTESVEEGHLFGNSLEAFSAQIIQNFPDWNVLGIIFDVFLLSDFDFQGVWMQKISEYQNNQEDLKMRLNTLISTEVLEAWRDLIKREIPVARNAKLKYDKVPSSLPSPHSLLIPHSHSPSTPK